MNSENSTQQHKIDAPDKPLSNWYRTVAIRGDAYSGWEAVIRYIWWPFWVQLGRINTSRTQEDALHYAQRMMCPIKL